MIESLYLVLQTMLLLLPVRITMDALWCVDHLCGYLAGRFVVVHAPMPVMTTTRRWKSCCCCNSISDVLLFCDVEQMLLFCALRIVIWPKLVGSLYNLSTYDSMVNEQISLRLNCYRNVIFGQLYRFFVMVSIAQLLCCSWSCQSWLVTTAEPGLNQTGSPFGSWR
jgi:hypothetical protein